MDAMNPSLEPPLSTPSHLPHEPSPPARSRLLRAWARALKRLSWIIAVGLLIQTSLVFWVPWALQGPVAREVSVQLGRQVSIQSAQFNPFQLRLTLDQVSVQDSAPGSEALLSVQQIFIDVSARSLMAMAPILDRVTLTEPRLNLVRRPDTSFNVSDLAAQWGAPRTGSPTALARFLIRDLELHRGTIHFDDQHQGSQHAIEDIEFLLPSITTLTDPQNQAISPSLTARLHGGEIQWSAQAKPFAAAPEASLTVVIKGLNVADALKNASALMPWSIQQGRLDAEWKLSLQNHSSHIQSPGQAQEPPHQKALSLQAQGHVLWQSLQITGPAGQGLSLAQAQLEGLGLQLDFATGGPKWSAQAARAALVELEIQGRSDAPAPLSIHHMLLNGLQADSVQKSVTVASAQINGAQLQLKRQADGSIDFQARIAALASHTAALPEPLPASPVTPEKPWKFELDRLDVSDVSAHWRDESTQPPTDWTLEGLQGQVQSLSSSPSQALAFDLQTQIKSGGAIAVQGRSEPTSGRLDTDIQLKNLNLNALKPYLSTALNLDLATGYLDLDGHLGVESATTPDVRLRLTGTGNIHTLDTREPHTQANFLGWRQLKAKGLDIDLHPLHPSSKDQVNIEALEIQDLFAKIVINPQGRLNLQDLLQRDPSTPTATPAKALSTSPQWAIGGIRISGGRLNFTDLYIQPRYHTTITDLNATLSSLSMAAPPAQLQLQGRIEGDAPLLAEGTIKPFGDSLFLDLTAKARGIDLPTFSPYSAKYAGYPIVRGKLSMEVSYRIEQGRLEAQNSIFLDQLTFGERVESPKATQLPVLFAVALLKNSRGEIKLHLPVSGSLNDPQFSVGSVVGKALFNLVKKTISSPFTLLASIFGSGEADLSSAEFIPGTAELSPEALPRLEKLAQSLKDRPALKLDLAVHIHTHLELGEWRKSQLMERLLAARHQDGAASDSFDPNPRHWSEKDYALWLQRLYDKTPIIQPPRNALGLRKQIPATEMETLLLATIVPGEAEWQELAQQRAHTVRSILSAQIPSERMFTLSPVISRAIPPSAPDSSSAQTSPECSSACVVFSLR